jgi:hypothetical protein
MKNDAYEVQILTTVHEITQVRNEWVDFLKKDAVGYNFWQDPGIICQKFQYDGQGEPRIILVRRNRKIECVAPCVIYQTRFNFIFSVFRFPGPQARIMKIIDGNFIFSKTADFDCCIKTVIEALESIDTHFDLIKIDALDKSCPFGHFFLESKNHRYKNFQLKSISPKKEQIWRHIFSNSYEEWLATLGYSARRRIKRGIQNLYKQYPDKVELLVVTRDVDVPKFLDLLDDIYPKTWQAKTFGFTKRNNKKDIIFYKYIADQGWLRSYMLLIDSRPASFFIGTQYNDIFEGQEIGYDNEFSSTGVGSVLMDIIINDLYTNNKPSILNFGFGENIYKLILSNNISEATEAYIIKRNIWNYIVKLQIFMSMVERKLRYIIIKYKIDTTIRKILKRK